MVRVLQESVLIGLAPAANARNILVLLPVHHFDIGKNISSYADKDPRVKFYSNKCNAGAAASRNIALSHTSPDSRYIVFLDSDDWIDRNYIA
jgi:predicted glycosyltransferase involved in capsule biosynthesis